MCLADLYIVLPSALHGLPLSLNESVAYLQFACKLLVLQSQGVNLGLQSGNQSCRRRQAVLHLSTHTQSNVKDHSLLCEKQNEL